MLIQCCSGFCQISATEIKENIARTRYKYNWFLNQLYGMVFIVSICTLLRFGYHSESEMRPNRVPWLSCGSRGAGCRSWLPKLTQNQTPDHRNRTKMELICNYRLTISLIWDMFGFVLPIKFCRLFFFLCCLPGGLWPLTMFRNNKNAAMACGIWHGLGGMRKA